MERFKTKFLYSLRALVPLIILGVMAVGCGDEGTTGSENETFFESGQLANGESFSYTFEEEGSFDYYCRNHSPDMVGQISVSSSAQGSDQDTVRMDNLEFNPSQLTVPLNATVVWINEDSEAHTVTSGTPSGGGGGY